MTLSASNEKIEASKDVPQKKFINVNLISLKCLVFLFFGGIGCLFPFLPLHMVKIGLNVEQIKIISMISPAVAILGPLIAGPLADKLAGHQGNSEKSSTGRHLRVMIGIACIFSALFYIALLFVPVINRVEIAADQRPSLTFTCDRDGAILKQDRCKDHSECHQWSREDRVGPIVLENCNYACNSMDTGRRDSEGNEGSTSGTTDIIDFLEGSGESTVTPLENEFEFDGNEETRKSRRYVASDIEPPHICYMSGDNVMCNVHTEPSQTLHVNVSLMQPINEKDKKKWCQYPVIEYFECRIPWELQNRMVNFNQSCAVECSLKDPYSIPGSVLVESQCQYVPDQSKTSYWMYLIIRSIADIFPTAAITLIDAAIVIATRETSCGRGDVGRQLAFGALGFTIFGPLSGYLSTLVPATETAYYLPIALHAILMLLAAVVAFCANGMPLSPPEWWWQTRCGMLALPMSAIKRYGSEIAALTFVLIIMGTFWSSMDSYLPLYLQKLGGDDLLVGVAMTLGMALTILFLWKSEHLVDYCGHSNLLITAFTVYIIRFVGLSIVTSPWYSLILEILELFTLGIMWITSILYFRHLVPRHLSVTAQALPVIAHFCVGRCLGAVIGAYVYVHPEIVVSLGYVYRYMAIAATLTAALYFILYHGLLKPRCHAQTIHGPRQTPTIVQAMNGNGSYTPLRVYHNGMGKKGQFRY